MLPRQFTDECARKGDLAGLERAQANGWAVDECTVDVAAAAGRMDVLEWLYQRNVQGTEYSTAAAARGGQLDALRWLLSHGCAWDQETIRAARESKNKALLVWVLEHLPY